MAEFICKYGTPAGEILQRAYVAENEKTLRTQMEQQGFYVFGIQRKFEAASALKSVFAFKRKKVSDKQFLIFNQEFASLIHSGLPLLRSLQLLMERQDNPEFSLVLEDVYSQVKQGTSLSDAFASHPDVFPRVYTASVLSGEKSGTLEQVIRRYLTYVRIILAIRTKVISSLIYPSLLLLLSCGVIALLIGYVIPKFSEFYSGLAKDLPLITTIILSIALFVRANALLVIVGIIVIFAGTKLYLRSSESARKAVDRLKLKLPYLGSLWTKFSISQLTRTLHTLIAGGIPLVNSIDVAAGAIGNRLLSVELSQVSQRVKEGEPLWSSLQKTGLMTKMAIEMVKVGEETGSLEDMLKNISDFYDEEIETNLTNVLSIVEPAMLIVMGFVIASVLLAMYYPLFTVITTIK
jgi:type IV pilus assembly protein PilC